MNSGKLRNRIDYYAKVKSENDFGEVTYNYSKSGSVWAQITPVSGKTEDIEGNSVQADITHKFIIRKQAIKQPRNDMFFMYRGQRYEVMYFMPNYLKNDTVEFYCKLVIETEEDYGTE